MVNARHFAQQTKKTRTKLHVFLKESTISNLRPCECLFIHVPSAPNVISRHVRIFCFFCFQARPSNNNLDRACNTVVYTARFVYVMLAHGPGQSSLCRSILRRSANRLYCARSRRIAHLYSDTCGVNVWCRSATHALPQQH